LLSSRIPRSLCAFNLFDRLNMFSRKLQTQKLKLQQLPLKKCQKNWHLVPSGSLLSQRFSLVFNIILFGSPYIKNVYDYYFEK
jgi:hypothetical protein